MSLNAQIEILNKMGDLGESVPGLDVNSIIKKLTAESEELSIVNQSIDEEEKEDVERGLSKEEARKKAETQKKRLQESYQKNIKKTVNEQITSIRQNYKVFKDSIESIPPDVTALITNIALPATVTVPPGAPNPIYALNLTKQAKNTLGRTLNSAIVAFTEVLKASNSIKFEIPTFILDLFEKIAEVNKLISSIPI